MGTAYDAAVAYAAAEGTAHGRNAADWYELPDGSRSRHDAAAMRRMLDGINDGDPAVLDTLPAPDLSGQWADTLTGPQLVIDALASAGYPHDGEPYGHAPGACATCDAHDASGDILDAYDLAFAHACEDRIAERIRYQLS